MKTLLTTTAAIELGAGLVLTVVPSTAVQLLLGVPLDTPVGLTVGRVTGAALLTLAVACWLSRRDHSHTAKGLVVAMLLYNILVAAVLAIAGIGSGLYGIGLWPGVVLHSVMGVWCVVCLRGQLK